MNKLEIENLLDNYGIASIEDYKEIDTSKNDYRLNIIIDKKYVLRINNNPDMNEDRLKSIARLCERYRQIGLLTPLLYLNKTGEYISPYGNYICYLSEYLDYQTANELNNEAEIEQIRIEILKSIGTLSAKYSDVDLYSINSMWSIIDLAPLDVDIDEKQGNINTLTDALNNIGENQLANKVHIFNIEKRNRIKSVYKKLPRCMIQGDLNYTNILVKNGHFVGLIDFNLSGTEVNINNFCCETNGEILEADFISKDAKTLFDEWIARQNTEMQIILSEYKLNELEKSVIEDYRSIVLISQYPNVMDFLHYLNVDKEKILHIIRMILER